MKYVDKSNAWVFVSHSNKDFDKIITVRNKLEALSFKPLLFFLKCLDDDAEIFNLIKREIKARDRFILCDSQNAQESRWVQREVEFIKSLNRSYEIVNLEDTEEEINKAIENFSKRSTVYIWSTDDAIEMDVAKRFVEKSFKVEVLPDYYLKDYYCHRLCFHDMVSEDFHEVTNYGYVLLLISRKLTENEVMYIDTMASWFKCNIRGFKIYVTSKESMDNFDFYNELANLDGIRPQIITRDSLDTRNNEECVEKIVADLVKLDAYISDK